MDGIFFVTDDHNKKIAVQIDLTRFSKAWTKIYDILMSESVSQPVTNTKSEELKRFYDQFHIPVKDLKFNREDINERR